MLDASLRWFVVWALTPGLRIDLFLTASLLILTLVNCLTNRRDGCAGAPALGSRQSQRRMHSGASQMMKRQRPGRSPTHSR